MIVLMPNPGSSVAPTAKEGDEGEKRVRQGPRGEWMYSEYCHQLGLRGNIPKGMIRRQLNIAHRVTILSLVCLSFLVESAVRQLVAIVIAEAYPQ